MISPCLCRRRLRRAVNQTQCAEFSSSILTTEMLSTLPAAPVFPSTNEFYFKAQ